MRREKAIEALNVWKKNPKNIRFESLIKSQDMNPSYFKPLSHIVLANLAVIP